MQIFIWGRAGLKAAPILVDVIFFFLKLELIENLCFEFQKLCIDFKDVSEKFVADFSTGFNLDSQRLQWIQPKTQSHTQYYKHVLTLTCSWLAVYICNHDS